MLKLIIFDWDDVFTIGSTEGYFKCYHKALASVGFNLDPQEEKRRIQANWGKHPDAVLTGLLLERPDLLGQAANQYGELIMGGTFLNCLSPVEGSATLLNRLKDSFTICLATGVNPQLLREKIIPRFGFPNVFSQVVSAYDIKDPEKGKPHPYMVQEILGTQNVAPQEAILVGDAQNDVLMARAAEVIPVVVLTGHLTREEAEGLEVEYIIPDVTRLEVVLKSIREKEATFLERKI